MKRHGEDAYGEHDDPRSELTERLLHGLLSGEEGARDELRASPGAEEELADLQRFLSTCRQALLPEVDGRAEQLVGQVLARTTREDPGWRGDLRLVRRFVASRWRASWVLRVAAASLMLHVAALPLLAYFGFTRRAPDFTLSFGPRSLPSAYSEGTEPEHEVQLEPLGELPEPSEARAQDELEIENALRWARFHLEHGAPPAAGPGTNEVTRALAERGSYLRGEAAPGGWAGPSDGPGAAGNPVVRVVWVEHLLDRFVLERRVPAGFSRAIRALEESALDPGGAAAALGLRTLLRARAYGLLDRFEVERLAQRLSEVPSERRAEIGAWDPLGPGTPLDSGFLEALRRAAADELARDAVGRSWLPRGE